MKKFLENKSLWITLIVIVALGVGSYFWIGYSKTNAVEKATKKFITAFQKYDLQAMKDMSTNPEASLFKNLEHDKPLYEICAKNADIRIVNDDNFPIKVRDDNTATVTLRSTNFNTYAFKYNISKAKGNKKKIKDAISKVKSDRPADVLIQLKKVDGKWKIDIEETSVRELLGDVSFWGDVKVTLTGDILKQLKDKLGME